MYTFGASKLTDEQLGVSSNKRILSPLVE